MSVTDFADLWPAWNDAIEQSRAEYYAYPTSYPGQRGVEPMTQPQIRAMYDAAIYRRQRAAVLEQEAKRRRPPARKAA